MIQRHPTCVLILTPKGSIVVARCLFDRLEARMLPDDLGLLRDHAWWVRLSELITGIEFPAPTQLGKVLR
jgi:hypothetical protein